MVVIAALCLQWKHSVQEWVTISVTDCLSLTFIQPVYIVLNYHLQFKHKCFKPPPSDPVDAIFNETTINRGHAYQSVDTDWPNNENDLTEQVTYKKCISLKLKFDEYNIPNAYDTFACCFLHDFTTFWTNSSVCPWFIPRNKASSLPPVLHSLCNIY